MSRITISLPRELSNLLQREARRRGYTVSALVRQAIETQLGGVGGAARKLPFASVGRSGKRHTARDAEEILGREWGRARDR